MTLREKQDKLCKLEASHEATKMHRDIAMFILCLVFVASVGFTLGHYGWIVIIPILYLGWISQECGWEKNEIGDLKESIRLNERDEEKEQFHMEIEELKGWIRDLGGDPDEDDEW